MLAFKFRNEILLPQAPEAARASWRWSILGWSLRQRGSIVNRHIYTSYPEHHYTVAFS